MQNTPRRFAQELAQRLNKRRNEVFGYLVNLAWIMLFREMYVLLVGKDASITTRFIVAIVFTIVSVAFTMLQQMFTSDDLIATESTYDSAS